MVNCELTTGLLPWLLNDSLDGDERRLVEEHLAACAGCRRELAETRDVLHLYATHLPVAALVAYAEGAVPAGTPAAERIDPEAVAAHLDQCAGCREELALVRESREALSREGGPAQPAVTAFDRAIRRRRPAPWRRGLALAASLTLLVVASAGWLYAGWLADERADRVAVLERRLEEAAPAGAGGAGDLESLQREVAAAAARAAELEARLDEAGAELGRTAERLARLEVEGGGLRGGATVSFLVAPEVLRGGPADEPVQEVPAAPGQAVFFLDLAQVPAEQGPFAVRVVDREGRTLLEHGGLTALTTRLGRQLTVIVPTAGLPAGSLTLHLAAGGRELAALPFRLTR
jgi:predicted anti-sigma-YlaC factor YlaD